MRNLFAATLILLFSAGAFASPHDVRLTPQQAQALIEHLANPTGNWNEFSVDAQVITIAESELQSKLAVLEKEFWQQSTYAGMDPVSEVDYAQVVKYAQSGGISLFREMGKSAIQKYLAEFVSQRSHDAKARAQLLRGLPEENAFGVGYTDSLSDPFGDELFVFPFIDGDLSVGGNGKLDLLVITIHHVHA